MKSFGFTLAEVLITLGIIGIVAAMTLPTLVNRYKNAVIEKKLYTTYNILQNVVRSSVVDNGDPYNWDLQNTDSKIFEHYFAPYLKIIQKCKYSTLPDAPICDTSVRSMSGRVQNYAYKYILNNGTGILFVAGGTIGTTRRRGTFLIDTLSGPKERILGINVFPVNLISDKDRYSITSSLDYGTSTNFCNSIKKNQTAAINDCKTGISGAGYAFGIFCTALIECNDWKIPDYYPTKF